MRLVRHAVWDDPGTEQILALSGDNTKIIPEHGALSNRAELEAYRQMLVELRVSRLPKSD